MLRKILKWFLVVLVILIITIIAFLVYVDRLFKNDFSQFKYQKYEISRPDSLTSVISNSWFRKEQDGIWTLYIEGNPFERGVIAGQLSARQVSHQEDAFIEQIHRLVPSDTYLKFLKYLIGIFDYKLYHDIPEENRKEIRGISYSASDKYGFIGTNYERLLNYHGAHDMGHMLNNLGMVGCTSFAAWDSKTEGGRLLIGRNFDFYVGDEFSKEKIVMAINPDSGYRHVFITWGGMVGAVSGMNEKGLTVTINAANSDIGLRSGTPVALVARQMLQYAKDIKSAVEVASRYNVFVSELFLIGSAYDNKAVILEKKPGNQVIVRNLSNNIICTNHFQSRENGYSEPALEQRFGTASGYRYSRVRELLDSAGILNKDKIASILRNYKGMNSKDIGIGNEAAINQLIAHHSIIFDPQNLVFWISTSPYQFGKYLAFDLNAIFKAESKSGNQQYRLYNQDIPEDTIGERTAFNKFAHYKQLREKFHLGTLNDRQADSLVIINPFYYESYELAGDYYRTHENMQKAYNEYNSGLKCFLPGKKERERMLSKMKECVR